MIFGVAPDFAGVGHVARQSWILSRHIRCQEERRPHVRGIERVERVLRVGKTGLDILGDGRRGKASLRPRLDAADWQAGGPRDAVPHEERAERTIPR